MQVVQERLHLVPQILSLVLQQLLHPLCEELAEGRGLILFVLRTGRVRVLPLLQLVGGVPKLLRELPPPLVSIFVEKVLAKVLKGLEGEGASTAAAKAAPPISAVQMARIAARFFNQHQESSNIIKRATATAPPAVGTTT